jgi:predicted acyltransferase
MATQRAVTHMSQPASAQDNVLPLPRGREKSIPHVAREPARLPRAASDALHAAPATAMQRIGSVDALRGFTILWILGGEGLGLALREMLSQQGPRAAGVGNVIGDQLTHAQWEGVRFYDVIFPLFIFITGVAIVLSVTRLVAREGKSKAHLRVLRRSLLLFALGVFFYGGLSNRWPDIRLLGVLQRIALCYLFASILFLNLRLPALVATLAALLVGYWALMTFVPVPEVGTASYGPEANLANWIDLHYLPGRKWNGTWDPEGLLSTIPAIGTCLVGVLAGMLIANERIAPQRKALWLVGSGIVVVLAGYLWSFQFPLIKSIWTSSFALVTAGIGLLLLGITYQIMDVWRLVGWATIFVWLGANAITLYLFNNVAGFDRLAARLVGGDAADTLDRLLAPGAAGVAASAVGLTLAILLAGYLYRRRIFLRL